MIPFLLHGRIFGGVTPPPPGIINPPGWNGAEYLSDVYVFGSPATATITFTIDPGGTWTVFYVGGTESGQWINPTSPGAGSAYKVRFTVTGSAGSATVVNEAPTIVSLSAARQFSIEVVKSTAGSRTANRYVLLEIFDLSDNVLAAGTFHVTCTAEYGT